MTSQAFEGPALVPRTVELISEVWRCSVCGNITVALKDEQTQNAKLTGGYHYSLRLPG